jgi:hypothetical protein
VQHGRGRRRSRSKSLVLNCAPLASHGTPITATGKKKTVLRKRRPAASSEGIASHPSKEPDRSGASCSEPTYVRVVVSNGDDDGDPGAIAEAYFTVEDGAVVLRDADDKHITSRALLKGQDPVVVARALLREAEAPKNFRRPISYPKLGLA